jgi:hypothetical protein
VPALSLLPGLILVRQQRCLCVCAPEVTHLKAHFPHQVLGRLLIHAGDRVQEGDLWLKRAAQFLNPRFQLSDTFVQKINVRQDASQQARMVRANPTFQRCG